MFLAYSFYTLAGSHIRDSNRDWSWRGTKAAISTVSNAILVKDPSFEYPISLDISLQVRFGFCVLYYYYIFNYYNWVVEVLGRSRIIFQIN